MGRRDTAAAAAACLWGDAGVTAGANSKADMQDLQRVEGVDAWRGSGIVDARVDEAQRIVWVVPVRLQEGCQGPRPLGEKGRTGRPAGLAGRSKQDVTSMRVQVVHGIANYKALNMYHK